jgi:hypothetical protein
MSSTAQTASSAPDFRIIGWAAVVGALLRVSSSSWSISDYEQICRHQPADRLIREVSNFEQVIGWRLDRACEQRNEIRLQTLPSVQARSDATPVLAFYPIPADLTPRELCNRTARG